MLGDEPCHQARHRLPSVRRKLAPLRLGRPWVEEIELSGFELMDLSRKALGSHRHLSDSLGRDFSLRQEPVHSMAARRMVRCAPHPPAASSARSARRSRPGAAAPAASASKTLAQTSTPEAQANDPRASHRACSEKRRSLPCQLPDGRGPTAQTMDASDTKPDVLTSHGRSYAALYNGRRPHSSLDRRTPDQAYFTPLPLRLAG